MNAMMKIPLLTTTSKSTD